MDEEKTIAESENFIIKDTPREWVGQRTCSIAQEMTSFFEEQLSCGLEFLSVLPGGCGLVFKKVK